MAKFELKTYGENDEIRREFETDHVRWGVYLKAVKLQKEIENKPEEEQLLAMSEMVCSIFPGCTIDELEYADADDIINTFKQLTNKAAVLNNAGADSSKNA